MNSIVFALGVAMTCASCVHGAGSSQTPSHEEVMAGITSHRTERGAGDCADSLNAYLERRLTELAELEADFRHPYLLYLIPHGGYLGLNAYFVGRHQDGRFVVISAEDRRAYPIPKGQFDMAAAPARHRETRNIQSTGSTHENCFYMVMSEGGELTVSAFVPREPWRHAPEEPGVRSDSELRRVLNTYVVEEP